MSDRLKYTVRLNRLLENNFFGAKVYRKIMKSLEEEPLKEYFHKRASKRCQFAIELSEEIGFLKGAYSSYGPFSPIRRNPGISEGERTSSLLEKAIELDEEILKDYRIAISEINHGSTREILIRHISILEHNILHLQILEAEVIATENNQPSLTNII